MKKTFVFFLILFTFQGNLVATKLKNIKYKDIKIPIIFQKHDKLPIFNLQLVFKNSGYINDSTLSGLSSISSKILNEGTLSSGTIKFSKKLESKAIEIHSSIGFETFVIEVSCLKEQYKNALKYLEEILTNPNLTKNTLNKIKNIQLSKLAQKQNDFDYIASNEMKHNAYKNTPYQNNSIGKSEDINKISLNDVKNNINNMLNINNLIVVGGGDIKYDDFQNSIKSLFKHLSYKETTEINKIKLFENIKSKTIIKETQQSYIYFISPFNISIHSKDNYKAKLASFILGESGFGSRLMEEVRVKNGLAYSIYAYIVNKKSHSHFTGYLQTKIQNTKKAQEMVKKIINDFSKEGVTNNELESAKKFIIGSEPLKTETFSQKLNRAFSLYYKGLDFSYTNEELNKISNITRDELNTYIKKHNEINNLSFFILTNKEQNDKQE